MQQVVITGASGFLGSALVDLHLNAKCSVLAVTRKTSDLRRITKHLSNRNLKVKSDCQLQVEDFTAAKTVINAACSWDASSSSFLQAFKTNLELPMRLLSYIKQTDTVFVNVNTFSPRYSSEYSLTKHQASELALLKSKQKKLRYIDVKLQLVYGQGENEEQFVTWLFNKCLRNEDIELTTGEQLREFVHINDVANAFKLILENTEFSQSLQQQYEIGSKNRIKIKELVHMIHACTKSKSKLFFGKKEHGAYDFDFEVSDTSSLRNLGWEEKVDINAGLATYLS